MNKRDVKVAKALTPAWVVTALKRSQMPLNTLFDLSKLKELVSREDLAVIYCMNQNASSFLGIEDFGSWLKKQWAATDAPLLNELEKTLELYPGLKEPRLYAASTTATGGDIESGACTAFEIAKTDSIADTTASLVVVIHPGAFGEGRTELQADLRRAYLSALYDFLPTRQLAQDPVFGKFLACV